MRKRIALFILVLTAGTVDAQNLTPSQKESDFRFLTSLFATYYAPYEWKKQLLGVDALDVKPWLAKVAATKTDLDFYEVCVEYVASLNDTHDRFSLQSDFLVRIPMAVDVYDGKVLIETITRSLLPLATFPFQIGDEIISIDGKDTDQALKDFAKYAAYANPISTRRLAATRLVSRPQSILPHAPDVGVSVTLGIRRQNGAVESYSIPWIKTGTPVEVGPVPTLKSAPLRQSAAAPAAAADSPDYMGALDEVTWSGVDPDDTGVTGFGARNPVFLGGFPSTFIRRFGGSAADFYYSGTFKYEELTFGYIRIPNYSPPSQALALQQFEQEIAFMQSNTDGLIVDEMRNTGGSLCFGEEIAARLIPYQFQATGFQLRAYWTRLLGFYNSMIAAKAAGAPGDVIARYETVYQALVDANAKQRGLTAPVPLCTSSLTREPLTDSTGRLIAYRKPIMMLIDEFSVSTADSVAGMIQDAGRAVFFGMRTNGAGGNNTSYDAGPFSEGFTGMTIGLQTRKAPVATPDYPATIYIENVGVRPNVTSDYMTKDNLLQSGAPFVRSFLESMAAYVRPPSK